MPKRKRTALGPGEEERSSTAVMGLGGALSAFADTTGATRQQRDRLRFLVLDGVAKASRVAVLASWLLSAYLAWLPDEFVATQPALVRLDQAACLVACGLVNGLGHPRTGQAQPLMKFFFDDEFAPAFPDDFAWPRLSPTGNVLHALAKEMATNYANYLDSALPAHAIAHLKAVLGVNKATARKLWKTAVRSARREARVAAAAAAAAAAANDDDDDADANDDDANDDDDATAADANADTATDGQDDVDDDDDDDDDDDEEQPTDDPEWANRRFVALDMARRFTWSPFLFHRHLLAQVEERHRQRDNGQLPANAKIGDLFPLFPQRKIRSHFTAFDTQVLKAWARDLWPAGLPEGLEVERLVEAFFPERNGWLPGRQIKTDGVRVSLTYTKVIVHSPGWGEA